MIMRRRATGWITPFSVSCFSARDTDSRAVPSSRDSSSRVRPRTISIPVAVSLPTPANDLIGVVVVIAAVRHARGG